MLIVVGQSNSESKASQPLSFLAKDLGPRPQGPVAHKVGSTIFEFTDKAIARMIPINQMMRVSL